MTSETQLTARRPALLTLVVMASLSPLALNIFVPALPQMATHFRVDYSTANLLVSLYLAAIAAVQLIIGPASDRFGRRPVLLISLSIFCVATVGALYANSMAMLIFWRVLQCSCAAGLVLARVIIRDTTPTERSASLIGYVTMGMSVTPMLAPFIGGLLSERYDWQATFWFTLGFGLVVLFVSYFNVHETNHYRTSSITAQFRAYPELLRSVRFWGYSLTAAFGSGIFYGFLGGAPYISSEMLGLSSSEYGFYFGIVSFGYLLGNFLSGRYAMIWGMQRLMMAGNLVALAAMLLMLALFAAGFYHPLSLFLPSAIVGVGNGMTLPSANTGVVSVKPHLAGSASGLGGAMALGAGAVLTWLGSALLSPQSGPYPAIYVCLASAVLAIAATALVSRRPALAREAP